MSFELFVFQAQNFAVKLQSKKPGSFVANFQVGLGAIITQFLMGLCFARVMAEGQKQWQKQRKQKNVRPASK